MSSVEDTRTKSFFKSPNTFLGFRIFYTKLYFRMILNYVLKCIAKLFDIPFCFMQYVCNKFHKLVSH